MEHLADGAETELDLPEMLTSTVAARLGVKSASARSRLSTLAGMGLVERIGGGGGRECRWALTDDGFAWLRFRG